jgi:hypothetical protein
MQLGQQSILQSGLGLSKRTNKKCQRNRTFIPVFILTYEGKFTPKTNLIASGSYQFGTNKYSGLDWYNAQNPAPDYYKNLPSLIDDPEASAEAKAYLQAHPEMHYKFSGTDCTISTETLTIQYKCKRKRTNRVWKMVALYSCRSRRTIASRAIQCHRKSHH